MIINVIQSDHPILDGGLESFDVAMVFDTTLGLNCRPGGEILKVESWGTKSPLPRNFEDFQRAMFELTSRYGKEPQDHK